MQKSRSRMMLSAAVGGEPGPEVRAGDPGVVRRGDLGTVVDGTADDRERHELTGLRRRRQVLPVKL